MPDVSEFYIPLLVADLDIDDDSVSEAIAASGASGAAWSYQTGIARVDYSIAAPDASQAVAIAVDALQQSVPDARPILVERFLVGITDIAERVGVTREAVRHWANGTRRAANFPAPVGEPSEVQVDVPPRRVP